MSDWFVTDDDCLQCCRPVPADKPEYYEFVQINSYPGHVDGNPFYQIAHGSINMADYSEEEILSVLAAYGYSGMDDFVLSNTPKPEFSYLPDGSIDRANSPSYVVNNQLLAEMFFEQENQEYVIAELSNWNDAVHWVAGLTQLDVSQHYDKDLLLVNKRSNGIEQMSITTSAELFMNGRFETGKAFDHSILVVPMHDPVAAVHKIAEFVNSADEKQTEIAVSPNARAQFPQLMQPIIDANIGKDAHIYPMVANNWGFEHMDYVKALDDVFSKLGILEVKRYRASVTQGEAGVLCNGKQIVRYGDDIKLLHHGEHDIFDFSYTSGPLYGPIIGGWGSTKPDELFRRSALTQYGKDIVKTLTPAKSLDKMIDGAKAKSQGTAPDKAPEIEVSR